jgi:uncharacterized protein (TIGR00369 family)
MLKYVIPFMYAVSPPLVYGIIRNRMDHVIPLNQLLGIEIVSIGDGLAEAKVALRPELKNHIGTAHATLMFGVAEAASGAAMAGALAPAMAAIRPVAAQAQIKFLKPAKSDLMARAAVRGDASELRARLEQAASIAFDVDVQVFDAGGAQVAEVAVNWHISQRGHVPADQHADAEAPG